METFKIKAEENLLFREREILRMISRFLEANLKFIVVGDYAVATFRHRFSVDLDIVVTEKESKKSASILRENNYSLAYSKELALIYGESFKRFEKRLKKLPVYIDLLVNGLVSRVTNASWGYNYIIKESSKGSLDSIEFIIPSRELLIATKIHSGRFADIRDIVALIEDSDFEVIKNHSFRGDKTKLKEILKNGIKFLNSSNFPDSFKGVFGVRFYNKDLVKKTKELFNEMVKHL